MIDAERRLLASALLDPLNVRFVLVSDTCIPLYSFDTIYSTLLRTSDSFMYIGDERGKSGRGRWSKGFLPQVPLNEWRKGSQWFQVTRRVARVIVNDTMFYNKFQSQCRLPCQPDEHYIPTMLHMKRVPNLAMRDYTFTDWSQGGAHPREFTRADVSMWLINKMKKKVNPRCTHRCYLFARKFRPGTLGPLMSLALSGKLWA